MGSFGKLLGVRSTPQPRYVLDDNIMHGLGPDVGQPSRHLGATLDFATKSRRQILNRGTITALLIFAVLLGRPALADVEAITTAKDDLQMGFAVGGKVASVSVKPGDRVEKGQVLITLDDDEGQALVELYEIRAASDLEVRAARAQLDLARIEERAIRTAFENQAAMPIEVERAQIKTIVAEIEVQMAQQRAQELKPQLRQAKARHDQYIMRAPTAGVVDRIIVAEGEVVETLKPILHLVATDPLWVDASVPIEQTLSIQHGDRAWVTSKLPGHEQAVEGKVIHLAQVADAASDTRLVRIEIPNPHGLPSGCSVTVRFTPPSQTASTTDTPPPEPVRQHNPPLSTLAGGLKNN